MNKQSILDCMTLVGSTPSSFIGTKTYVSTGAVDCDHIDYISTEKVTYEDRPSRANLVADEGDILFAKMCATRKTLRLDEETAKHIYSTGFCAVRANKSVMIPELLFHLLSSEQFLNQKDQNSSGATQKAITNAGIAKIKVTIPKISEQHRVAKKLNIIDSLITARREQVAKLDLLVISRFIELFGTLDNPVQKFKNATLKELCNKITDGKHGGCTQEEGTERFFVGAREIYDDVIHYDTAPEISAVEFEKDYKRCNIEIGDLLIVNTGATIGKSAIATDSRTEHTLLQKSVALLKVKKELLNPIFLKWCYRVNTKMYMVESASAQPNLLLSRINATVIYVPDIELQNQFAAFAEQTNKSKLVIQQSLDKLELLKKSLMQEYFG